MSEVFWSMIESHFVRANSSDNFDVCIYPHINYILNYESLDSFTSFDLYARGTELFPIEEIENSVRSEDYYKFAKKKGCKIGSNLSEAQKKLFYGATYWNNASAFEFTHDDKLIIQNIIETTKVIIASTADDKSPEAKKSKYMRKASYLLKMLTYSR